MRHSILILVLAVFTLSCGQSNSKEKELALKEKELELQQKELELQQKQFQNDSAANGIPKSKDLVAQPGDQYLVIADKSYFYDSPDLQTRRKGYLVSSNIITVKKTAGDFAYTVFTGPSGNQSAGWVLLADLQKISVPVNESQNITLAEIYQANNKIFSDQGDKIFTDPRLLTRMKNLMGKKDFEDFQVMNIWGLKNEEVNSSYFFTYYNSCPRACGTYGVIYGDISNNNLVVGFINLNTRWFKEKKELPLPRKLVNWQKEAEGGTLDQ